MIRPTTIQVTSGATKVYVPLQAMPRAVPHMELPRYQLANDL